MSKQGHNKTNFDTGEGEGVVARSFLTFTALHIYKERE